MEWVTIQHDSLSLFQDRISLIRVFQQILTWDTASVVTFFCLGWVLRTRETLFKAIFITRGVRSRLLLNALFLRPALVFLGGNFAIEFFELRFFFAKVRFIRLFGIRYGMIVPFRLHARVGLSILNLQRWGFVDSSAWVTLYCILHFSIGEKLGAEGCMKFLIHS